MKALSFGEAVKMNTVEGYVLAKTLKLLLMKKAGFRPLLLMYCILY